MKPLTYREERQLLKRAQEAQKRREDLLVLSGVVVTYAVFVLVMLALRALEL